MKKLVIVTGGGRGLGSAIIDVFLKKTKYDIVSISRYLNDSHFSQNRVRLYKCDLDLFDIEDFRENINEIGINGYNEIIYINNAFTIEPISNLSELDVVKAMVSININVGFVTKILPFLLQLSTDFEMIKLVNITSGAANRAIDSWGIYCASKAYVEMLFKVVEEENSDRGNVKVYNLEPGVIDTQMQNLIRNSNCKDSGLFNSFKEKGLLKSPIDAAESIFEILL